MNNTDRIQKLERRMESIERKIDELADSMEDSSKEQDKGWLWDAEMVSRAVAALEAGFDWEECPYKDINFWEDVHSALEQISLEGKE